MRLGRSESCGEEVSVRPSIGASLPGPALARSWRRRPCRRHRHAFPTRRSLFEARPEQPLPRRDDTRLAPHAGGGRRRGTPRRGHLATMTVGTPPSFSPPGAGRAVNRWRAVERCCRSGGHAPAPSVVATHHAVALCRAAAAVEYRRSGGAAAAAALLRARLVVALIGARIAVHEQVCSRGVPVWSGREAAHSFSGHASAGAAPSRRSRRPAPVCARRAGRAAGLHLLVAIYVLLRAAMGIIMLASWHTFPRWVGRILAFPR